MEVTLQNTVNTIADLKKIFPKNQVVLVIGKTTPGDGLGGFYRWDPSASGVDDTAFLNIVATTVEDPPAGRWVRVFQKVKTYPHGIMVMNGGVKIFYATGLSTDSQGKIVVNLTEDATTNGSALFTEIWQKGFDAQNSAPTANDVISGNAVVSANLKVLTYTFSKGSSQTLGLNVAQIVGANIASMKAVPAGVPVIIKIEGV